MRNDQKSQRERFIEAARELGADDDEATFKAKLAQFAKPTTSPEKTEAAPRKKRPHP